MGHGLDWGWSVLSFKLGAVELPCRGRSTPTCWQSTFLSKAQKQKLQKQNLASDFEGRHPNFKGLGFAGGRWFTEFYSSWEIGCVLNQTGVGQKVSAGHTLNLFLIQLLQSTAWSLEGRDVKKSRTYVGDGEPCWEESSSRYIGALGLEGAHMVRDLHGMWKLALWSIGHTEKYETLSKPSQAKENHRGSMCDNCHSNPNHSTVHFSAESEELTTGSREKQRSSTGQGGFLNLVSVHAWSKAITWSQVAAFFFLSSWRFPCVNPLPCSLLILCYWSYMGQIYHASMRATVPCEPCLWRKHSTYSVCILTPYWCTMWIVLASLMNSIFGEKGNIDRRESRVHSM